MAMNRVADPPEEDFTIPFIGHDRLSGDPLRDHMMNRAGNVYTRYTGHLAMITRSGRERELAARATVRFVRLGCQTPCLTPGRAFRGGSGAPSAGA